MPASKAQIKATNKYNASKYDNLRIVVPKGCKAIIEAHAKSKDKSVNALVNALLLADMGLSAWSEKEDHE